MKLKAFLGAVVMFGTMMFASVTAHAAATFTASTNTVPGTGLDRSCDIVISVKGDSASDTLNGFILDVEYDSKQVSMEQPLDVYEDDCYARAEEFCQDGVFVSDVFRDDSGISQTGKGVVAWAAASPKQLSTSETKLATLRFDAKDGFKSGSTEIKITLKQLSYKGTSAKDAGNENNGEITVSGTVILYGDVDGDGMITSKDATKVLKHIAKIEELTGDNLKAADVDGSEGITSKDATTILKRVANILPSLPVK